MDIQDLAWVVQAQTVVRWHRQGFRYYWRWKSRRRGRPKIDPEIRTLIWHMCRANPLRGAPRIHGELLKLGIEISEATVSKYMIKRRGPPSQTCTFLENHVCAFDDSDIYFDWPVQSDGRSRSRAYDRAEIEEYAVDNICILRHDTSRNLDGGVR